ncbi:MAG: hypothetical protein OXG19_06465 [Chloroflexi bacterium]|nr:hypothetical protein [Chloroflexota bacterium]
MVVALVRVVHVGVVLMIVAFMLVVHVSRLIAVVLVVVALVLVMLVSVMLVVVTFVLVVRHGNSRIPFQHQTAFPQAIFTHIDSTDKSES